MKLSYTVPTTETTGANQEIITNTQKIIYEEASIEDFEREVNHLESMGFILDVTIKPKMPKPEKD